MVFKRGVQLVCFLLLAVGTCRAADKIIFTPAPGVSAPPKESPCKIEIISEKSPARKYLELGTINFHAEWHRSGSGVKPEQALQKLQERACQVGADAIMNVQTTQGKRLEFAFINVRVTAIRFESQ
jgi:hypothetical protein